MYVVRRSFRNRGQMLLPGSTVEPGSIKWFKTRVKDRYIIEVNEHNFDTWKAYFADKFGIEIKLPVPEEPKAPEQPQSPEEPKTPEQPKASEQPKAVVVKAATLK